MTYWIDIECSNSGHEGREVKIRTFMRMDDPDDTWEPTVIARRVPMKREPGFIHLALGEDQTIIALIGDQLAQEWAALKSHHTPPSIVRSSGPDGRRDRYSLKCKLCGLKVDVRPETLYPILDQIIDTLSQYREFRGSGVVRLELAHLAHLTGIIGHARRRA